MNKSLKLLIVTTLSLLFSACNSIESGGTSIQPVKYESMDVAVMSTARLNPDAQNRSLPVLVRIYQLSNDRQFMHASFKGLWHDDITILGDSMIRQTEFMVQPGANITVKLKRNKEAKYIGVMALFRTPNGGHWRSIKELGPSSFFSGTKPIVIALNDNNVSVK